MDFDLNTTNNAENCNIEENDAKKSDFPQYLCRTCGRCCKSIAISFDPEEVKEMMDAGNEEASVFVNIFKKYENIEEARKVVPEQIDQVIEVLAEKGKTNFDDLVFYYCPHITDKGLCGIYETRPTCCRRAPHHGWSVMPPACGFEGWQFEQREYQKKLIRWLKEYLYMAENLSDDGKVPGKEMTLDELRQLIGEKIAPWKRFGSEHW